MLAFLPNRSSKALIRHLRRIPPLIDDCVPSLSIPRIHPLPSRRRCLYGSPSTEATAMIPFPPPPSKILQPIPSAQSPEGAEGEEDSPMNEFLSRLVWAIRPKLSEAFPGLPRESMNAMLLLICQRVVGEMDGEGGPAAPAAGGQGEFSSDLWETILEVSNSVHAAMKRDKMRKEMKKYLHCDDVKEMCRFAGDIGIRGDILREMRFKWAREKLEDVEFYNGLDRMVEQARKEEEGGLEDKSSGRPAVLLSLPERKGKIRYKIYGLDLSGPEWEEVAERVEEAESQFVPEEPQLVEGQCKRVEDEVLALNPADDPSMLIAQWKELLGPKKVDWYALLDRIADKNPDLYFKVFELILAEESFETNVRDYSRLIGAYSNASRIDDVEKILQKMSENGVVPDVLTSITLVHMYSKTGNLPRAKDAFESLVTNGFKPNLKTYNSMITAYVKAGVPKSGEALLREMESRDIKPTREMYMGILRAFSELGQVDGAQRMVNTMQFSGMPLTLESSTLLVEANGKTGDAEQARWHFDDMVNSGIKPDDRCVAGMVLAYKKKNLLDKALDLLLSLEGQGFQPELATNSVLLDWMCLLQLVDEAEQLRSKIMEEGDFPFELHVSLCEMYSKSRLEDKARASLKILEARKELLGADQFERVVGGLVDGGLILDAKRIHEQMQKLGLSLPERIQVAIMSAQTFNPAARHAKMANKTAQGFFRHGQASTRRW